MSSIKKFAVGLIFCFGVSYQCAGAIINVPSNYSTIQAAINAASNGDIIVVSPGVYNESINFNGKAITVTSINPSDTEIVRHTVIRAVGQSSVVTFSSGESRQSVLKGFTLSGGYGTVNPSFGSRIYWGGGIYCCNSSPTIKDNIISSNISPKGDDGSTYGYGSGIACIGSGALISGNIITANDGYAGGGISVYLGNARIISNLVFANSAIIGGGAALLGGGEFINNTVVRNMADNAGNVYAAFGMSTGQCVVFSNIISNATSGGGICLDDPGAIKNIAYNNVWQNVGGNYIGVEDCNGLNGNISQDPQFIDAGNYNYRIKRTSGCVNAGDPNFKMAPGDIDFYDAPRVTAGRVDIGAAEYNVSFRPVANAGIDQLIPVTSLPVMVTLDGSASWDPNGAAVTYHWTQTSGAETVMNDANAVRPMVTFFNPGIYVFSLIVNNGEFASLGDTVQITIHNDAPTADAGVDQTYNNLEAGAVIKLDGSRSFDTENGVLSYRWRQIEGMNVKLSDKHCQSPSFVVPRADVYAFELVVNDGMQDSKPDVVGIVAGRNHEPVADAGSVRYVTNGSVTLDGSKSYDRDGYGNLTYRWRQISGPSVNITGKDGRVPLISGFIQTNVIQTCVFELVVSDGEIVSKPSSVAVMIVPYYGNNVIKLVNPPFDLTKPTIVAFGGGTCTTGGGMTFGGEWEENANWITVDAYGTDYSKYGDMLMIYLSNIAVDYTEPIQTTGFSTGNLPAMEVAWYINAKYKDPHYAVNRVSLLDAVCSDLSSRVSQFHANPVGGEQCWVDNYISNDPHYGGASIISGALNIVCNPYRSHGYPVNRYVSSRLEFENSGLTGFGYLSVIGAGKNYQLNTASQKYFFAIDSAQAVTFYNESLYPGKILSPVVLVGPADGNTVDANGAVFSCQPCVNAVKYQLLMGPDPYNMNLIIGETSGPTKVVCDTFPYAKTYWTIKAYDQFGSSIYADPIFVNAVRVARPIKNPLSKDYLIFSGYKRVGQKKVSQKVFEYCFKMKVKNMGLDSLANVTLDINSVPDNITVLNDKVYFSSLPGRQEVLSDDTFVVRIDHEYDEDQNDICWERTD